MFKLIPSRRMTDGLSESFFILLFLIMPVNIVDTQPLEEDLSSKRKEDEKEERKKEERIMPSLVATTSTTTQKPCVRTHYVRTNI